MPSTRSRRIFSLGLSGPSSLPLFYAFQYGVDQYLLPYEAVYFLYIFITGRVTLSHVIPALALRAVLCGILLALVAIPWWKFVGIM